MASESVRPNGDKIKRRRRSLGLSQEKLAAMIARDVKTIRRAEAGHRIYANSMRLIANVLQRSPLEFTLPDILNGDDQSQWLRAVIARDEDGRFTDAIEIGEAIVDQSSPKSQWLAEAVVRLATFYDHVEDWESALGVLAFFDDQTTSSPNGDVLDETTLWGYYQRGLICRRLAECLVQRTRKSCSSIERLLTSAKADLRTTFEFGNDEQRIAAQHQLGVLCQLEGDFQGALELFNACISWRRQQLESNPSDKSARYRLGYEHRRRGQVNASIGNLDNAESDWNLALDLARATGHVRLLRECLRDMVAWLGTDDYITRRVRPS